jgi:photosystem I subunit 12
MPISDTQVFVALMIALLPGFLAFRLSTELYK